MIVEFFLKWARTASVSERVVAAAALARAFCEGQLAFEERCAAESALTLLLDDPSARVRAALAEAVSMSVHAPLQVVTALAADQPEVAALVLARSPLLGDNDLIERIIAGGRDTQSLIARRPAVSLPVSSVLAEIGEAEACEALLQNDGAEIAAMSFRRMTDRFGNLAALRGRLAADPRLPPDCRLALIEQVSASFCCSAFVGSTIGAERAGRVLADARARSAHTLVEHTPREDHGSLVEHLREQGGLTVTTVVRSLAMGQIDFFGTILSSLSGQPQARVRSMLADAHRAALTALFARANLPPSLRATFLTALFTWREVAAKQRVAGVQEVSFLMMQEAQRSAAPADLTRLLKSIHLDALRANAKQHALMLAAA